MICLLEECKVDSLHEPRHDGHTGFEKALMDAKGLSKEMIEQEKNHGKRGGGGQGAGKSQDAPLSLQQGGGSDSAGAGMYVCMLICFKSACVSLRV